MALLTDARSRLLGRRPGQDAYIVRYCTIAPGPDEQASHGIANYPRDNEVQCDTAGNVQIGPPDGIDYSLGQPPGSLNIDPAKGGVKFRVITQSAGNFDSAAGGANTVAAIRDRAVQAAKAWYVEALEALSFEPFLNGDGSYNGGDSRFPAPQYVRSPRPPTVPTTSRLRLSVCLSVFPSFRCSRPRAPSLTECVSKRPSCPPVSILHARLAPSAHAADPT